MAKITDLPKVAPNARRTFTGLASRRLSSAAPKRVLTSQAAARSLVLPARVTTPTSPLGQFGIAVFGLSSVRHWPLEPLVAAVPRGLACAGELTNERERLLQNRMTDC